jgi:CheY-like chemotaxis protein
MEPEPALAYAAAHPCDAAIIDVRMTRSPMDGLEFLRALRRFDRDLAIIIRTASDSDEIADGAIELRAIKRAVKSKTTLAELRRSTQEAVKETRERREMTQSARSGAELKTRLVEALGAYDLRLAAAEIHRGLIHGMRGQLTALSALAAVLNQDAARSGNPAFAGHSRKSAELVGRMVDSVNRFLDGPFGENSTVSRTAVNLCLGALRQYFQGAEWMAAEGKRLAIRDLLSDTWVDCAPLALVNGLRHAAEFFLARAPAGTEVSLTASVAHDGGALADQMARAGCTLNRSAVRTERPHVVIRISAPIPDLPLEAVRDSFSFRIEGGRTGNLNVLSELLTAARGAVILNRQTPHLFVFEALFPVSL